MIYYISSLHRNISMKHHSRVLVTVLTVLQELLSPPGLDLLHRLGVLVGVEAPVLLVLEGGPWTDQVRPQERRTTPVCSLQPSPAGRPPLSALPGVAPVSLQAGPGSAGRQKPPVSSSAQHGVGPPVTSGLKIEVKMPLCLKV